MTGARVRSRPSPYGAARKVAAFPAGRGIWATLPAEPGTYALIFHLARPAVFVAGALGRLRLPAAYYVYTGSALGPGGLRARLARHVRGAIRPRWHVDYLRMRARPVAIWLAKGSERQEHVWASVLAEIAESFVPRFGASDCRCPSHLFRFARPPALGRFLVGPRVSRVGAGLVHLRIEN